MAKRLLAGWFVAATLVLISCGRDAPATPAAAAATPPTPVATAPAVDAPTLQACREYENELSASGLGKFKELILANTGGANPQELSAAERAYTPIQARAAVPRVASSIDAFNGVIAVDLKYGGPPTVAALNAVFASVQQECTVAGYSFS